MSIDSNDCAGDQPSPGESPRQVPINMTATLPIMFNAMVYHCVTVFPPADAPPERYSHKNFVTACAILTTLNPNAPEASISKPSNSFKSLNVRAN